MSDVTMCDGIYCPIRSKCYRYCAIPNYYQFYFIKTPFEYEYCDKFISLQEEQDLSNKKFVNTKEQNEL
jgi:hypothetical protein